MQTQGGIAVQTPRINQMLMQRPGEGPCEG